MREATTNTSSLPSVCNYLPPSNTMNDEMIIYDQTNFFSSLAEEEILSKKQTAETAIDNVSISARNDALASMRATLLKTISNVCIHMIEHHREMLKRQYKIAAEEMESIQRKHA
ncbi:MAG: hypothetical protein JSS09_04170 [Verrucomicrobia bacterium]|nr:hypothetical protein [Verrucomicrobiota bacterium]